MRQSKPNGWRQGSPSASLTLTASVVTPSCGNFTVLGEAAGQLSTDVREKFPEVPWQQPIRLRNRIVHGYWSIDLEVLHTTATEQLPAFSAGLRNVLGSIGGSGSSSVI
jgi:uncharacterized protein with HEPN domain